MTTTSRIVKTLRLLLAQAGFVPSRTLAQQYLLLPACPSIAAAHGASGCQFTVGSSNVVVSHLGYYQARTRGNTSATHHPVRCQSPGVVVHLYQPVRVPWQDRLQQQQLLLGAVGPAAAAEVQHRLLVGRDGRHRRRDWWGDSFQPEQLERRFLRAAGLRDPPKRAGAHGSAWPAPSFSTVSTNSTFLLEGLAGLLPNGPAKAGVKPTCRCRRHGPNALAGRLCLGRADHHLSLVEERLSAGRANHSNLTLNNVSALTTARTS